MRRSLVFWIVSMAAVAAVSAGLAAQAVQVPRTDQVRVLSGSDIGFRVEGRTFEPSRDQTGRSVPKQVVTGHFVVKINGEWMDVSEGGGFRPATN